MVESRKVVRMLAAWRVRAWRGKEIVSECASILVELDGGEMDMLVGNFRGPADFDSWRAAGPDVATKLATAERVAQKVVEDVVRIGLRPEMIRVDGADRGVDRADIDRKLALVGLALVPE